MFLAMSRRFGTSSCRLVFIAATLPPVLLWMFSLILAFAIVHSCIQLYYYSFGMAASMGAFLLGAGAKGKRRALPNSRIMIHQPLGGAQGQAADIEIQASSF